MDFDSEAAQRIKNSKKMFSDTKIKSDLLYIKSNFKIIETTITQLESVGMSLSESMNIFEKARTQIESGQGAVAEIIKLKLKNVLNRNPGYSTIYSLYKIFSGEHVEMPPNISVTDATKLKFLPVTSCDVERSFSLYKNILTEKRHSLTPDNIEKLLICYNQSKEI
jgi:exonuclease VII small subunit